MCQVGSSDQLYQNKNQQVKQNIVVNQQQNPQQQQKVVQPVYQETETYNTVTIDTSYSDFMERFNPLSGTAVEGKQPPAEEKLSWKQRKRRNKDFREWYHMKVDDAKERPGLVSAKDLNKMIFGDFDKKDREHWEKEVLPHSKLTRGETLRKIIEKGDYSNFENLDELMRNRVATSALESFHEYFHINEHTTVDEIMSYYREHSEGVSMFLDPALRLGFSLAQKTRGMPDWAIDLYRELDEAMSTEVMVATLTHVPDMTTVASYYRKKKSKDPYGDAFDAMKANSAQQIQLAKRLLLMQMSDFYKVIKDKNGTEVWAPWDKTMAVALSHCSRVALTLPRLEEKSSNDNAQAHQRMWNAIYTVNGNNDAQDNSRMSSTHDIERRKVEKDYWGRLIQKERGKQIPVEEKKVHFNFTGQRGMNCAIGGLGNNGVGGELLSNDGSCGHFYSMYKEADAEHYGSMLMGLESDAAGVMNQMGHTHDLFATQEKASSLGAQRTDEVGVKYGGRQCDLSGESAKYIAETLIALEKKMLQWQQPRDLKSAKGQPEDMGSENAKQLMRLLAGKEMGYQEWQTFNQIVGIRRNIYGELV